VPRRDNYRDGVEIIDLPEEEIGYERQRGAGASREHPGPPRRTASHHSAPPARATGSARVTRSQSIQVPSRRAAEPVHDDYIPSSHQLSGPAPFHVRPAGEVRPARSLCIARRPDALSSQQYRLLKYKLKEGADPRVIGVTSPRRHEGKTTAAANLGLALAEGRRVRIMLLDLNLRHPRLAAMFGIPAPGSVAEQLRRKRRDPDTYWDVLELGSRLHLMAGTEAMENPAALLNSDEVGRLLSDLAEHYDYVVVDLPAVLIAADVKIVQEQLDGLVLVCRAGSSTRVTINSTVSQLGRDRIHGLLMLSVEERYIPK
jgi:Mrp family chromosome partitioning ATPase